MSRNQFMTYKLFVQDLYSLSNEENKFKYKDHTVKMIEILGIVRSANHHRDLFFYDVDDGTGIITCWCPRPDAKIDQMSMYANDLRNRQLIYGPEDENNLNEDFADVIQDLAKEERDGKYCKVGDLINVKGVLKEYNNRRYVDSVSYNKIIGSCFYVSNRMTLHIKEQLNLYKIVYDCPLECSRI